MGTACLENGQLIYHAVEVIPRGKSPQETLQRAKNIILRLIEDLSPDVIAVEKNFFGENRTAALLNSLHDEIRLIARRKGLKFVSYAPSSIKKYIVGNGWADKAEVAAIVVARFPELKFYLTQHETASRRRFFHNMSDAIAVGLMASKRGAA